jgi:hypothetical protein
VNRFRLIAPIAGLTLLTLFVVLWFGDRDLYARLLAIIGIPPFRYPFLDWEGVSAFIECWRRGVDVYAVDPCDVRGQLFNYSPIWLEARFIPFGAAWRNAIGLSMDAAFVVSLGFVLRPMSWREAAMFTLACVSPAAIYGAERANVDMIVFVMVVAAAWLTASPGRRVGAYALLLFAGLLKFYPLAALIIALRERPRAFWTVVVVCGAVLAGFVIIYSHELPRVLAAVPPTLWAGVGFGARNLGVGFGALIRPAPLATGLAAATALVAAGAGVWLARPGAFVKALRALDGRESGLLIIGAALTAGCFFTGWSGTYRAIFLIPAVGGLLAMGREAGPEARRTVLAGLALFLLWDLPLRSFALGSGMPMPAVWWLAHELAWWTMAGALAAVLVRLAWDSEAAAALRRAVQRQ